MLPRQSKKTVTSTEKHRRQVISQILLPILTAAVVFLGFGVLVSIPWGNGLATTGQWAAISIIWLILPVIILTLVFLGLTGGLIILMAKLLQTVTTYTQLVYLQVNRIGNRLQSISNRAVMPVIRFIAYSLFYSPNNRRSPPLEV